MTQDKLTIVFGIFSLVILGTIILLFIVLLIDMATLEKMRIEKIECYDRYGNEILGQTCEKEINCGWTQKIVQKDYCYGGGK